MIEALFLDRRSSEEVSKFNQDFGKLLDLLNPTNVQSRKKYGKKMQVALNDILSVKFKTIPDSKKVRTENMLNLKKGSQNLKEVE